MLDIHIYLYLGSIEVDVNFENISFYDVWIERKKCHSWNPPVKHEIDVNWNYLMDGNAGALQSTFARLDKNVLMIKKFSR